MRRFCRELLVSPSIRIVVRLLLLVWSSVSVVKFPCLSLDHVFSFCLLQVDCSHCPIVRKKLRVQVQVVMVCVVVVVVHVVLVLVRTFVLPMLNDFFARGVFGPHHSP